MPFETAKPKLQRDAAGALIVPDVVVRWRARQAFTMDPSPPSAAEPLPPGQPFVLLGPSRRDPANAAHQIADMRFQGSFSDWHVKYDSCCVLTQVMQVQGGVGPKDLTIILSCVEHPKLTALQQHVKQILQATSAAAHDAVAMFQVFIRRIFKTAG